MLKARTLDFGRRLATLGTLPIVLNLLTAVVFADEGGPGAACQRCGCVFLDHFILCWPPFPFFSDICYTHVLYFCNYGLPVLS